MAPFRDLPAFVFFVMCGLLGAAEFSSRKLPEMGVIGAIALRVLGGEAVKLYPSFGDPAQRLAAFVAMLCSIFFYGGVLSPFAFPGSRAWAFFLQTVRLSGGMPPHKLDVFLWQLGWAGVVLTIVASVPALFPWELRGSHERPPAVGAAPPAESSSAAAVADASSQPTAAAVTESPVDAPVTKAARGSGDGLTKRR